jgi:hypothetical protein
MFRGLEFGYQQIDTTPKLIYVVDGERMERSKQYQELVCVPRTHTTQTQAQDQSTHAHQS